MGRAKAQPLRQKTATEWPLKGGKRSADAEAEGGKAAAFTGDWHLRIAAGQRGGRGVAAPIWPVFLSLWRRLSVASAKARTREIAAYQNVEGAWIKLKLREC